jgi:thiosulfate dehydrogenase (quinone) large subunit
MMQSLLAHVVLTKSTGLSAPHWLAILRIGLGLWWLESFRHKDKKAWFQRGSGIAWAKSVAEKHKWGFVRSGFDKVVAPRPKSMAYVVVLSELAVGLGITVGLLAPVALAGGLLLNVLYFVLMIDDWAEQGQNSMMALISVVCIFAQANQAWSLDHAFHIFGA